MSYIEPDFYGPGEECVLYETSLYYEGMKWMDRIYYYLLDFSGREVWNSVGSTYYYLDSGLELGEMKAVVEEETENIAIVIWDEQFTYQRAGDYRGTITFGIFLR